MLSVTNRTSYRLVVSQVIQRTLPICQFHYRLPKKFAFVRKVADVGFKSVGAVDTLSFGEDSVVGSEEKIVEKLEQTGILVLQNCQHIQFTIPTLCHKPFEIVDSHRRIDCQTGSCQEP
jgi:hypothetical protein